MRIHYWKSTHGNFGDDLNLWLWETLLPGIREERNDVLLVGVGTVLSDRLPPDMKKLVIGSGAGYGNPPRTSDAAMWDIRAVRGRKTARLLGLDDKLGMTDPAALIADIPEFQNISKQYDASFLPHWESHIFGNWKYVSQKAGVHYINPCEDSKQVIREIARSRLIIAESMHAAILADAFRIPWIAVKTSDEINRFKWEDWSDGLGVIYEPVKIELSTLIEARYKKDAFLRVRLKPLNRQKTYAKEIIAEDNALKRACKNFLSGSAIRSLERARRSPPQLSDPGKLHAKKDSLKEVLHRVSEDYLIDS